MESLFVRLEAARELPTELVPSLPETLWVKGITGDLVDAEKVVLWGIDLGSPDKRVPLLSRGSKQWLTHFDLPATVHGCLSEEYRVPLVPPFELTWLGSFLRNKFRPFPPLGSSTLVPFPSVVTPYAVGWLLDLWSLIGKNPEKGISRVAWPKSNAAALLVSYNVENGWIFRHKDWFQRFLSLDTTFGLKSAWFCIPKKSDSRIAKKGLELLRSQGREIGCLGYNGDGRLPFLAGKSFQKRVDYIQKFAATWE